MVERARGSNRTGLSASCGQSLVETALTLPVILLMLFGIVELSRIFMIYGELANAAAEGARYGLANPGDSGAIAQATLARLALVSADQVAVTVSYDDGASPVPTPVATPVFGNRVVVSVTHDLSPITPLITDFTGPLHIEIASARTILASE